MGCDWSFASQNSTIAPVVQACPPHRAACVAAVRHGSYLGRNATPNLSSTVMTQSERVDIAERELLRQRRARLTQLVGSPLRTPKGPPVPPDRRTFLREEAEELYWNELSWEKLTDEEMIGGSELVEYTFPAFLAFVDGLLLRESAPDSDAVATPRPDVVEDILQFLAARCLATGDDEIGPLETEMTSRLIDLVLYRLHGVEVEGVDRLSPTPDDDD